MCISPELYKTNKSETVKNVKGVQRGKPEELSKPRYKTASREGAIKSIAPNIKSVNALISCFELTSSVVDALDKLPQQRGPRA